MPARNRRPADHPSQPDSQSHTETASAAPTPYLSPDAVAGAQASAEDLMLGFFGLNRMAGETAALDAELTDPARPAPGTHLGMLHLGEREE